MIPNLFGVAATDVTIWRTNRKPTKARIQLSPYQLTSTGPRCGNGFQLIRIIKNP